MAKEADESRLNPFSGTLSFDYLKSSFFRVIHVDGVHGGLRPNGTTIHMALFSERNAIPQHEEFKVTAGQLGERIRSNGREGVVREVEIDAVMDLDTARAIRDWLNSVVSLGEAAEKQLVVREE